MLPYACVVLGYVFGPRRSAPFPAHLCQRCLSRGDRHMPETLVSSHSQIHISCYIAVWLFLFSRARAVGVS
jgi:hypothetical protein